MSPDELDQFLVQHTSEISRSTPALFLAQPGRERHFGSGVLLQVEEARFLVTAAHVADDCFERYKLPCFGTSTFDELLLVNWGRYCRSKKQEDPNREDDPINVAVLELTSDVAEKLSEFMRFLTLDDLQLDPDKLKDGLFLVNGFPDFRAEKDEMDETIVADNLPYISKLYDIERFPAPNLSLTDHLAVEVVPPYESAGFSCGLDLDKAQGISGGGMWRLLDDGQPIESLDWRKAKLVAIVTDRSDSNLAGPVQYLRGTKIKHVVRMIYHGWQHLQPIIRSTISPHLLAK
jgi:hypothetical protein